MKRIAAVSKPRKKNDIAFRTNAMPSFFIKEVPSNKFVIHIGLTLDIKMPASPKVQTIIREDFRFSRNSSR